MNEIRERKTLFQSGGAMALTILTILTAFSGLVPSERGYVSILAAVGYIIATMLFAKRNLDSASIKLLSTVFIALSAVAGVISIIVAIVNKNFAVFGGPILDALIGTLISIGAILVVNAKFDAINDWDKKKFTILEVVMILIAPSAILMLSGIITTILELVLAVIIGYFIINAGASAIFSQMSAPHTNAPAMKTVYEDMQGKEHDTRYGAEKANEQYIDDNN